jgi:hypothetical protein
MRHDREGWQRPELGGGGTLERPREGEEERERVAWFGDPRGSFYRGRGGQWRGGRREEGAPSMAAGMGADGASRKGNDVSFGGERRRRGGSSPCGEGG